MKYRHIWVRSEVLFLLLLVAIFTDASTQDVEEAWRAGWEELADLRDGYVVWESNRTGRWRLWTRRLGGSGLRQLSPEEEGRDHFCPHIGPDGDRIVYLSYPAGQNAYQDHEGGVPMHLMRADGTDDRIVVEQARAYFEDRAALWIGDREFIYIAGDGTTRQLDLETGEEIRLTKEGHDTYGWLINATMTHATGGHPNFYAYDHRTQTLGPGRKREGCQPYFSSDGIWGYWMQGAGGPIRRIHLPTGEIDDILGKDDPSLPAGRNYLYFPMLSPGGELLAFGASPDQHDHFSSDYDIFVAPTDPEALELVGRPVRYTFHPACDRFPDVFVQTLELGRHRGEAPFKVIFTADGGKWEWHSGDGKVKRKKKVEYTYKKSGDYRVEARRGDRIRRGHVRVDPARPPRPLDVALVNEQEIVVLFDEPVRAEKLKADLASRTKVNGWTVSEDGHRLRLRLTRPLQNEDWLRLKGVVDRAQRPNKMESQRLLVRSPQWPSCPEGLVFLWQTADRMTFVHDPHTGEKRSCEVRPRGRAQLNGHYAMRLAGGAYLAEGADEVLLQACRQTNELTVEAVVGPDRLDQRGPARIITFSSDAGSRNFTLGQDGGALIFRLRTPNTGANGTNPEVHLCAIPAERSTHILVTYRPGRLVCYRDGEQVLDTDAVQGDFRNWTAHHLLFGDEWAAERDWAGTLEGIAIYNRAFSAAEAREHALNYRNILLGRRPVSRWVVQVRPVARSDPPTLEEILPYREALIICEYEVQKVVDGEEMPGRIRVAHWGILDGERVPERDDTEEEWVRLILEPFETNPQLESIYMSDTLEPDFEIPLYYAVAP